MILHIDKSYYLNLVKGEKYQYPEAEKARDDFNDGTGGGAGFPDRVEMILFRLC